MKVKKEKTAINDIDKERHRVLRRFFDLDEKALAHIKDSVVATKICFYCTADGTAAKLDEQKQCLECHGMKVVPDVSRRNWATDEIVSRIAPKPKAVEMAVDDKRDLVGLADDLKDKTDKQLKDLAENLGLNLGETTD